MCWYIFDICVLIHLSLFVYGQIHFYDSDRLNIHRSPIYFDCLYYYSSDNIVDYYDDGLPSFKPTHQVIPYCIRPVNKDISAETQSMNVTVIKFNDLREGGISVSNLLSWSAPIDVIEQYQEYLNDPTNKSSSYGLFYNCTWPWFGSTCQYSFGINLHRFSSIVRSMFLAKMAKGSSFQDFFPTPYTNLSCYTHVNCTYRGLPLCIDWREICDGQVDCYDDGIDEKDCFQLESNECTEDEFQCRNGMCIPIGFVNDSPFNYDCIDGTDEGSRDRMDAVIHRYSPCFQDPTFRCEELSSFTNLPHLFCGDGQTHSFSYQSYCRNGRHRLKNRDLWLYENNEHLTYDCWLVLYCASDKPEGSTVNCSIFCDKTTRQCVFDIKSRCSSGYVIYPQMPIYDGHVYRMYSTNKIYSYDMRISDALSIDFLCFDEKRCPFFSNVLHINGLTCLQRSILENNYYTRTLLEIFRSCLTIDSTGNDTHCYHPSHFHCPQTSKCISTQRLTDGKPDCYDVADEIFEDSCKLKSAKHRFECRSENKCIPWINVMDTIYDCINAEDENGRHQTKEYRLSSFQIICDGYEHISPILIDNRNESDETNCEDWPCSNIYTRADHALTCLNGEDELDQDIDWICYYDCPRNTYPCLSSSNLSMTCLPFSQLNDSIIDCLGAVDEQAHCKQKSLQSGDARAMYRCWNDTSCSQSTSDSIETTCYFDRIILSQFDPYDKHSSLQVLGQNSDMLHNRLKTKYFILFQSNQYPSSSLITKINSSHQTVTISDLDNEKTISGISLQTAWWCNRGLTIRYGLLRTVRCLCPPSYYGDRCQYQSQRVSLTLQFQPVCSPECEGLYSILITLLDQTDHVHSQEMFTYTPQHDCHKKFHLNLLYDKRRKNSTITYHLRVEAFNRAHHPLAYYSSWYLSIQFAFLPVNRVSALLTFPINPNNEICRKSCGNGLCTNYINENNVSYCRCLPGWTGVNCTIPYDCRCSSDALCVGWIANRSICLCPIEKFGPRCLIRSICQRTNPCENGGSCTPDDFDPYRFTCRCRNKYSGLRCEQLDNQIRILFNNLDIPQSILVYFVTVRESEMPSLIAISARIPYDQNEIQLSVSHSFHLVLGQMRNDYYLIVLQESSLNSTSVDTTMSPSRRCPSTDELLAIQQPLLRRIKSYHKICRDRLDLNCFHDKETFMCLCTNERHANCFDFNFNRQSYQCQSLHDCQNGASCFQDRTCPKSVMCICSDCYYGSKCQFTTKSFGLNLDTILSYQIYPNVSFNRQPKSIQFSLLMTVIMFIFGILSGFVSLLTFRSEKLRKVGCGNYFFVSSIIILLLMIIFLFKYLFLLLIQMSLINNRTFLWFNCITMDYLLRSFLSIYDWLNVCIAIERTCTTLKGIHFNGKKSKFVSRWIVLLVIVMTFLSFIHDPIHRRLIDDFEEKRTSCMMKYSYETLKIYDSIVNIFQFLVPFSINIISSLIIIITIARYRSNVRQQISYKVHLHEQCLLHKHLLISPFILILLSLPRLIISFLSGCMKTLRNPWLFLIGYFISFFPPLVHVFIFILPSKTYRKELLKVIRRVCRLQRRSI